MLAERVHSLFKRRGIFNELSIDFSVCVSNSKIMCHAHFSLSQQTGLVHFEAILKDVCDTPLALSTYHVHRPQWESPYTSALTVLGHS